VLVPFETQAAVNQNPDWDIQNYSVIPPSLHAPG
jgi:hypothetical protein